MIRIARYGTFATAAAVLLALGVSFLLIHRSAPLAFGQVVENIKKAKSVSFVTKMPTILRGSQRGVLQQKWYIQGEHYRMEIPSAQEGADIPADAPLLMLAIIADYKQKKSLQLEFVHKTAQFIEPNDKALQEMARGLENPIEKLRQLKNDDAEPIGQEELDGRKTQVYRLKKPDVFMGLRLSEGDTAKLWVDPKSGLPVRIRVDGQTPASRGQNDKTFMIFEQFTWDEALDPNLFKLDVPAGFTVEKK